MDIYSFVILGLIFFFASFLQSIVGFSFTLFSLPLLLFAGWPLPQAVAVSTIGSALQRVLFVAKLKDNIDWKPLIPMIAIGLIFLPLGIFILREVSFLRPQIVKQIIGLLIILVLFVQWFAKVEPKVSIPKIWGYISAACSGLLTGFANIGGPPIILWILAHRWHNEKMRVMTSSFTLFFVPFQILILPLIFGSSILTAFLYALLSLPIVYISTQMGLRVGAMLSIKHLRLGMQGLLLVIAIVSIVKPFLEG